MRYAGLVLLVALLAVLLTQSLAQLPPTLPAVTGPAIAVQPETGPDPFPIRRVFSFDKFRSTPPGFERLSRVEFEAQVQAASRMNTASPQLLEARYQATWTPEGLRGQAEWRLRGAGLFRVEPFNLAVQPDLGTLFKGEPFNKPLSNWLELSQPESMHQFNWSARAIPDSITERYELSWPAAPLATLELDLPTNTVPTVAAPALLAGTLPPTRPDRAIWLIRLSQQNRLDISLKSPSASSTFQPVVRLSRQGRYTLQPDQMSFSIEFTPDGPVEDSSSLIVEADRPVTWTDVRLPGGWQWIPASATQVKLERGPGVWTTPVVVSGFITPPTSRNWTLPQLKVLNSILTEDTHSVRLDPDLQLLTHDSGDYRLTGFVADRGNRLNYTGLPLNDGPVRADRKAPTLRVQAGEPGWDTLEEIRWKPLPEPAELRASWKGIVTRGPLSLFRIQTPLGYQASNISTVPADPNLTWSQAGATLTVEPSRPYSTGEQLELRVDYRPTQQMPSVKAAGFFFSFPKVALLGNGRREGGLEVSVPADHQVWSQPAASSTKPGSLTFRYAGSVPVGELQLTPLPGNPITLESELRPSENQLQVETQIRLPNSGLEEVLIYAPTPPGVRWNATSNAGVVQQKFGEGLTSATLFGTLSGWNAIPLMGLGHFTPGELWQVNVPRGAASQLVITGTATTGPEGLIAVPIPLVGQRFNPSFKAPTGTLLPTRGTLGVYPSARLESTASRIQLENLLLTHRVDLDGEVMVSFTGKISRAFTAYWWVDLPTEAELVSVQLGGKSVEGLALHSGRLRVPVPPAPSQNLQFEIAYKLAPRPELRGQVLAVESPSPKFADPAPIRREWRLSPEWRHWPSLENRRTEASEEPVRLIRWQPVQALLGTGCALLLGAALGVLVAGRGLNWLLVLGSVFALVAVGLLYFAGPGWLSIARPLLASSLLGLMLIALRWSRGSSVVVVCLLVAFAPLTAQAPELPTVTLSADGTVLAPKSLLQKLTQWQQPPRPSVIVTQALYQGQWLGQLAQFHATWDVELTTEEARWTLPLQGVRLQQLEWDKASLGVESSSPSGYSLVLSGRGKHTLKATFAVLPESNSPMQLSFSGPECPSSQVRFRWPKAVQEPSLESRTGRQELRQLAEELELLADHGGNKKLLLKWIGTVSTKPATLTVRQLALWDLSEASASGLYALQVQIDGGTVSKLSLDIPSGLQLDRPTLRNPDGRLLSLKSLNWSANRRLELVPVAPLEGVVLVVLKAYPEGPPTLRPVLKLLRMPEANFSDNDLAIRTNGLTLEELPRQAGIIDYSPDSVQRIPRLGSLPELGLEARPPERVLHQVGGNSLEARPVLRPLTDNFQSEAETNWSIEPTPRPQGVIRGSGSTLIHMLECECPASLALEKVQAAELSHWGRNGNRVQFWFKKPLRNLELFWMGNWVAPPLKRDDSSSLTLPVLRTLGRADRLNVNLACSTGWQVKPDGLTGWQVEASSANPTLFKLAGTRTASPLKVQVTPPQSATLGQLEERLEPLGEGLVYTARGSITWPRSPGSPFDLMLTGLAPTAKPELSLPAGVQVQPVESPIGQAIWKIFPTGASSTVVVQWAVQLPRDGTTPEMKLNLGLVPQTWESRRLTLKTETSWPSNGPEGWRLVQAWNGLQAQWTSSGKSGKWSLIQTSQPPSGSRSGATPSSSPPSVQAEEATSTYWPLLAALGWVLGLLVWLAMLLWCRSSWWPERISMAGFLGFWPLGSGTFLGSVFLALIVLGLLLRLVWLIFPVLSLIRRPAEE